MLIPTSSFLKVLVFFSSFPLSSVNFQGDYRHQGLLLQAHLWTFHADSAQRCPFPLELQNLLLTLFHLGGGSFLLAYSGSICIHKEQGPMKINSTSFSLQVPWVCASPSINLSQKSGYCVCSICPSPCSVYVSHPSVLPPFLILPCINSQAYILKHMLSGLYMQNTCK